MNRNVEFQWVKNIYTSCSRCSVPSVSPTYGVLRWMFLSFLACSDPILDFFVSVFFFFSSPFGEWALFCFVVLFCFKIEVIWSKTSWMDFFFWFLDGMFYYFTVDRSMEQLDSSKFQAKLSENIVLTTFLGICCRHKKDSLKVVAIAYPLLIPKRERGI